VSVVGVVVLLTSTLGPVAAQSPSAGPAGSPVASPAVSAEPTSTVVTSDDGQLTIEIPAGAAPEGVTVTATAKGPEDLPPELEGATVSAAFYDLQPEGTQFSAPVRLTRAVTLDPTDARFAQGVIPVIELALRSEDGTWEWLADQQLSYVDGVLTVSGTTTHLSLLLGFGGRFGLETSVKLGGTDDEIAASIGSFGELKPKERPRIGDVTGASEPAGVYAFEEPSYTKRAKLRTGFTLPGACAAEGSALATAGFDLPDLSNSADLRKLELDPTDVHVVLGGTVTCAAPPVNPFTIESGCVEVIHQPLRAGSGDRMLASIGDVETAGSFPSFLRFLLFVALLAGAITPQEAALWDLYITIQEGGLAQTHTVQLASTSGGTLLAAAPPEWTGTGKIGEDLSATVDVGITMYGPKTFTEAYVEGPDGQRFDLLDQLTAELGTTVEVTAKEEPLGGSACPG
jgi:hypothetical protein